MRYIHPDLHGEIWARVNGAVEKLGAPEIVPDFVNPAYRLLGELVAHEASPEEVREDVENILAIHGIPTPYRAELVAKFLEIVEDISRKCA